MVTFGVGCSTQEEFENGDFTPKTHQMFCIHTAREESQNVTITCQFGFVFEQNIGQENHVIIDLRDVIVFAFKGTFSKCLPSKRKRKANVFEFL